ncbi:hypothetical protein T4D_7975 [Trichinella pseudospiralis]|uniref:Uncharacterized protein n=1 Tax=Trichinella pseudospiralis TaxID=6337 RepID=A0A0V1F3A4_TRIPS|nr:hypothetical protein T4D_7975 [Trichinella pseudospiralis]
MIICALERVAYPFVHWLIHLKPTTQKRARANNKH